MVLGFHKRFVDGILAGRKIHTIRHGYRWSKGREIHMATGVRTSNYNQFNKKHPHLQVCKEIQTIEIIGAHNVTVDDVPLHRYQIEELAVNDGFKSSVGLFQWFKDDFYGQIIHWTDYCYS